MPHIAVVDDNSDLRLLLQLALTADGHVVSTYPGGEALLAALPVTPFDLIVLDLQMDGMSGAGCLTAMRRANLAGGTPVVMLTGSRDDADIAQAHRLGALGYVCKPFDALKFVAQVGVALHDPSLVWFDDLHRVIGQKPELAPEPEAQAA